MIDLNLLPCFYIAGSITDNVFWAQLIGARRWKQSLSLSLSQLEKTCFRLKVMNSYAATLRFWKCNKEEEGKKKQQPTKSHFPLPTSHLKNNGAVCVACEKSRVSCLWCLQMSRDAHITIAQSNFHVSVVVLHKGSVRRKGEGERERERREESSNGVVKNNNQKTWSGFMNWMESGPLRL